jgi:hypothetical protein
VGEQPDDDLFAGPDDPQFLSGLPHEPTAEERARAAARRVRELDLQRRLAEEAAHERRLAQRDRKLRRRTQTTAWSVGTSKYRNVIAPAVVLVAICGLAVNQLRNGGEPVASIIETPMPRPLDYPPTDDTVAGQPLGTPPPAPASPGPFEFTMRQEDGSPVAWDPCRPVRYVVNETDAPPGAAGLIEDAVARVATATGLVFEFRGTTAESWSKDRDPYQPELYDERWAPALIAWSDDSRVPGLAGYIAGMGGATPRPNPDVSDQRLAYVTGAVVLDSRDLGLALSGPGGEDGVRAVIQHEIGHMVGLDHVADPKQLMYSEGTALDWGTGDLAGLHQLGSGPCFPEL